MSIRQTTTIGTTPTLFVSSQPQSDSHQLLADIFAAYYRARANKRNTASQMKFEAALSRNLVRLYESIRDRIYTPDRSICFIIHDPVQREVFAAAFRDRVVHHYLYEKLEPLFEPAFIHDSYSCRKGKGTLFGIERLEHHIRSCSDNFHRPCYALKLDIKGYFMSIDRNILYSIVLERIDRHAAAGSLPDGFDYDTVVFLLHRTIFNDPTKGCRMRGGWDDWKGLPASKSLFKAKPGCGLPIGNLTSQLFSNVYLNELDQFVKRELGFRHYGRYVDDFYIIDESYERLESAIPIIEDFLQTRLNLNLNKRKIHLNPVEQGVRFLGAVIAPSGRFLRAGKIHRIQRKLEETVCCESNPYQRESVANSYRAHLSHFSNPLLPAAFLDSK